VNGSQRVVCDASALAEFVVGNDAGFRVRTYLEDAHVHVPDVAFVEAAHVLRKGELLAALSENEASEALSYLLALEVEVWGFHDLAQRAWDLRRNVTTYDAVYVALAEQIDAPLITLDQRLQRAPGIRCDVIVP
jgi:predicted nucleic acid-binding protein